MMTALDSIASKGSLQTRVKTQLKDIEKGIVQSEPLMPPTLTSSQISNSYVPEETIHGQKLVEEEAKGGDIVDVTSIASLQEVLQGNKQDLFASALAFIDKNPLAATSSYTNVSQ